MVNLSEFICFTLCHRNFTDVIHRLRTPSRVEVRLLINSILVRKNEKYFLTNYEWIELSRASEFAIKCGSIVHFHARFTSSETTYQTWESNNGTSSIHQVSVILFSSTTDDKNPTLKLFCIVLEDKEMPVNKAISPKVKNFCLIFCTNRTSQEAMKETMKICYCFSLLGWTWGARENMRISHHKNVNFASLVE